MLIGEIKPENALSFFKSNAQELFTEALISMNECNRPLTTDEQWQNMISPGSVGKQFEYEAKQKATQMKADSLLLGRYIKEAENMIAKQKGCDNERQLIAQAAKPYSMIVSKNVTKGQEITDIKLILEDLKIHKMVFLKGNLCNVEDAKTAIEVYNFIENQRESGNYIIDNTKTFMITYIRTKSGNAITESLNKALNKVKKPTKSRLKAD